jgi:hypothetical protein
MADKAGDTELTHLEHAESLLEECANAHDYEIGTSFAVKAIAHVLLHEARKTEVSPEILVLGDDVKAHHLPVASRGGGPLARFPALSGVGPIARFLATGQTSLRMITIDESTARKALSLAYSRMGQHDNQGEQAREVASILWAALGDVDWKDEQP